MDQIFARFTHAFAQTGKPWPQQNGAQSKTAGE
jgi:hypothetical protein